MNDRRASPDALLALASREDRGRLKIFLGAAPGVGKTFAMLSAAKVAAAEGQDVAVGLIETHGRRDTEALLQGFEQLPRKPLVYRNRVMQEFDLDAALARRPGLLLVDEYAHTNVPGSRHPKRWQDIDELLAAGIEVWTTLNIQHLESLNDIVQQITKVRVRETIPDIRFDQADEIVLVDLPPDELLRRLAEGKVYVEDTATRAADSFFKLQNLTALRELTLRRAAERIDATLIERMRANAIDGPWPARERVLACIAANGDALSIVRRAKRLADLMSAPLLAITVERPGSTPDEAERRQRDDALRLAEQLGAETRTLVGADIADTVLRYARSENITQIVVARARPRPITGLFRPSLVRDMIRHSGDIAVHVIARAPGAGDARSPLRRRFALPAGGGMPYIVAAGLVVLAVAIGRLLTSITPLPNLSMIFLVGVLVPATLYGVWPAIFASVLSFLAYNFFFIPPFYTFTIAEPYELLALAIFLGTAILTSTLAGRARTQADATASRMRAMRRLYELTRRLSGLAGADDIAEGATSEIHASLARPAMILLADKGELKLSAAWPPEDALDAAAMSAARWAFDHAEAAGRGTATLPLVPWFFIPIRTARATLGVIGVFITQDSAPDGEERALLDAIAEQAAAAFERAALARDMIATQGTIETERVRNTVLASISHDFRTPLASILGAATSLIDYGDRLDGPARRDLLVQIKDEVEHLDAMVRNLLAMTRIDAGALEIRRDWVDLREIVYRVVGFAQRRNSPQAIDIDLPASLPLVKMDALLGEQAITNVIGNAIVHAGPDARIRVRAGVSAAGLALAVEDDGRGIPPDRLPHIFEKFFSHPVSDARRTANDSTGLGLAIAKGIVEAHGGTISVESPPPGAARGTRVTMTFPMEPSS